MKVDQLSTTGHSKAILIYIVWPWFPQDIQQMNDSHSMAALSSSEAHCRTMLTQPTRPYMANLVSLFLNLDIIVTPDFGISGALIKLPRESQSPLALSRLPVSERPTFGALNKSGSEEETATIRLQHQKSANPSFTYDIPMLPGSRRRTQ